MPLHESLFALLGLAACLYGATRGGPPEQITSWAFVAAYELTRVIQPPRSQVYQMVEWSSALIDGLLLLVLIIVACRSTRYWALPMASMQVLGVMGHIARILDPAIAAQAYFAIVGLVSWPMIALLATGTWFHKRRLKQFGIDFSWVGQLPPAYRAGWLADEHRHPGADEAGERP